jgi:biotin synthase
VLSDKLQGDALQQVLDAAKERMWVISGKRGRVWAAIGVDAAPCPRSCDFCSFGSAWNVYPECYELSPDDVCRQASQIGWFAPDWLTLRTTQDYGIARLCSLAERVRHVLPSTTELVVNTGEFDMAGARALKAAGVNGVYHTYRLREGVDTGIAPADRLTTLRIIQEAGLKLAALVEPVGPEHTDKEIVESAFRLKEYGVALSGCMARVPVPGTPLAKYGSVSNDRIVRIVAMTRLISGPEVEAICIHPPLPAALCAGANTVVVECGAIPRADRTESQSWRGFNFAAASQLFAAASYKTSGAPIE